MSTTRIQWGKQPARLVWLLLAIAMVGSVMSLAVSSTRAQSEPATVATASDELGTYLVGPNGLTLYFFTRDVTPGMSACNGPCAEFWPPLLVDEGQAVGREEGISGVLGVVKRADATFQVTYDGRPLYYWKDDAAPGDTLGQGSNGIWFVAMVDGSMPANPAALTLTLATGVLGSYLTNQDGLTFYYFANDVTPGLSTCYDACAENWPPALVTAGNTVAGGDGVTGVVGIVPRIDGSLQATYDGRPLYHWKDDAAPGDTLGHGLGGVWFVAAENGSLASETGG